MFDRPWTAQVEDRFRHTLLDIARGKRPARPIHDLSRFDHSEDGVDVSLYDDWDIEMYRWARLQKLYDTETQAYRRLKRLQGHGIPRLYGVVQLTRSAEHAEAHPALCTVSGIALEYLDGDSLDRAPPIDRTLVPSDEDQARGHRALDILRAAHALGVVHRDITWQNVVSGPDGSYAIIDWGHARLRGAAHSDEDWLAIRGAARDLTRMRYILQEHGRYDPTPIDTTTPTPWNGYMRVNHAALMVKDPARRAAWFESVPYPEPGWKMVRVPGRTGASEWQYRMFRVRPGVRVQECYDGEPL